MANSDLAIGRLSSNDLSDAQALVAEAGWNQVAADWRVFLDFGTAYAVRHDGRVIATAATLPYGRCAWISMVLVAHEHRRRGIATRLLHRCIEDIRARGLVPVLDATPAGAKVYAPLGFVAAWSFARLTAERRTIEPVALDGLTIEPITDATWPALCRYDGAVFGADRGGVLARMRGRLPGADLIALRGDVLAGLLLGRDGRTTSHLGPLIAEDAAVAKVLLAHALARIDGPVYLDLADAKPEVRTWLEACGFTTQRPFTRMLLGAAPSPGEVRRTFAVIGPEFG